MGLGVKNINLGKQYHDYLKRQVEQLGDTQHRLAQDKLDADMRHKNYNLQGMTDAEIKNAEKEYNSERLALLKEKQQENLNRFTRCSGELAKEYGLDGALSSDKMNTIADLEMGKDPRTEPFVKVIKTKVHTIKDESTAHIIDKETGQNLYLTKADLEKGYAINELGKDIAFEKKDIQYFDIKLNKHDLKNGYVVNANDEKVYFNEKEIKTVELEQRKTATELTFSVDNTFSYRYQMMNDEQKKQFEKIFFESADKAFNDEIAHHFKNSQGVHGSLLVYDVMHTDNRDGMPFIHIHKDVSNIMKMADGSISATELDAIKEKGFHQKVDALFKAEFIERFKESFPEIAIETYDKEKKSVLDYDKQRVKDYRVAFDQESLDKIRKNSTTPEKIDQVVKQQLKDERNRFDKVISGIETERKDGLIDNNQYYKKLSKAHQEHDKKDKFINSSKNKASIQSKIKNRKSGESLDNKEQRLDQYVSSLDLREKDKDVGLVHPTKSLDYLHDNSIINNLTATRATFTENELITEYVNHYGTAGKDRALKILDLSKSNLNGIENDMIAIKRKDDKGRDITEFTSKSLIAKEYENLAVMRNQMALDSKVHIPQKELSKEIATLEKTLDAKFADGQKEFINAVFNEKNATIAIGVPGAGKSFAINGASKIAHDHGFETYGIAPTNKVSADLGTTAIGKDHAFTVQSFNAQVANGKIKLNDKSIVFMDEASMVDTRSWNDLLKNIDATNAKLVVVGDTNQISAVGAGQTLTEFMQDKDVIKHRDNIVVLDEITRQKDQVSMMIALSTSLAKEYKNGNVDELKASGDHIRNAFEIMENNDRVNKFDTTKDKIDGLVKDYMQDKNACKDKLVLASTNESVSNINNTIQDARLKNGELSKESISNGDKDFRVGDRIIMKDNEKENNAISKNDEKVMFKEFANTKEQKQAYKDFKDQKISESDFKEKQKESFNQFKHEKTEQQEKQYWKDFQKTDEQKQATKDFKSGKVDEKTYKESQQVDFAKYKLDHGQPLSGGHSNGDIGTIKELRDGKAVVAFDNGTVSQVQIQGNEKVDLGYAMTLHKSQGQTVNNSYLLMENSGINNQNLANVAFTRNRQDLQVYATTAEYDAVKETYARQDGKQLLTDIGREHGLQPQQPAQEHSKPIDLAQHQEQSKSLSQSPKQPEMAQGQQVAPEQKAGFFDKAKTKLQGMVDKFRNEPQQEQSNKVEPEIKKDGLHSAKDAMETNTKIEQKKEQSNEMPDAIKAQKALEQQGSQSQSIKQEQTQTLNNEIAQRKAPTQEQANVKVIKPKTRQQGLSI